MLFTLLKLCAHTSTVRPAASHVTSSPGPNTTDPSTLDLKGVNVSTEQPFSRSSVPGVKLNERAPSEEKTAQFSTTESPHTQMETSTFSFHTDEKSQSQSGNLSSGFDGDTITPINATETSLFDFLNATMNTSAEPGFLEASATAEPSETSTSPPEPEYQRFNTTSGNKDQQRRLKWNWED